MTTQETRFKCLNCQTTMILDPTLRKLDDERKKVDADISEGLEGQSLNLFKIICNAEVPSNAPICNECSDELLRGLDQQMKNREDECSAYRELIAELKNSYSSANVAKLEQDVSQLEQEERNLKAELDGLIAQEARLDDELIRQKRLVECMTDKEKNLWATFRDNHKLLLDLNEKTSEIEAELHYAERQHSKLSATNVLDLCFHIWVDPMDSTVGEINGLRLGRLPDRPVEWLEINAAWGQLALLLDVAMQRVNVKADGYKVVPMGSHSYIQTVKATNEEIALPLHASGSWKPFGHNNIDAGVIAYLKCFEALCEALKEKDPNFRLMYRIHRDSLVHSNINYSVKMWLNSEERWTRAMKMLLTNIKTALVQVAALRSSN